MKSSLLAALALYALAVVGIGTYVYADPGEGIATMLGYSIAYMLIVAIVTLLSTRKSKGWTSSRRLTTVLLWTTGFLVAFHVRQVIDSYNFNSVRRELASASGPEQALAMLQGSNNAMAQLFKHFIESVNNGHARMAAILDEVMTDPLVLNSFAPLNLADPVAFEASRKAVRKRLSEMDALRSRMEAVVHDMQSNFDSQTATITGISDETRSEISRVFEGGMSNLRDNVNRGQLRLVERMLLAIDTLQSFLVLRRDHYEVTDEQVRFYLSDDAEQYNRLFGDVKEILMEMESFNAEIERKRTGWASMRWLQEE